MKLYFSDFFEVSPDILDKYGAFNISLLADLPLFIDPFLLFNSKKRQYQHLHKNIITYLRFLKTKSLGPPIDHGLVKALYTFHEVSQNWLGFTLVGNSGSGLGMTFANALHRNLRRLFGDFGDEDASDGSHLEKLCLIESGVGRDNVSDFTTNLIKAYLLDYTEAFARDFIRPKLLKRFLVRKVSFNYKTESWQDRLCVLPCFEEDFVLLTPKDMLTKDQTWINREDLYSDFDLICEAVPNDELRAQINNYFMKVLPEDASAPEKHEAVNMTIRKFPELINAYIRLKEKSGAQATQVSSRKVKLSEQLYLENFGSLVHLLDRSSGFYRTRGRTYQEALRRVRFLKDVIENKGGHKLFYLKGRPLERESDLHILYRLTWYATPSDISREVNDGRGPADFKVSRGAKDKALVEFKLASNSQLERNLTHQTRIYEKASDAPRSIKVILYFSGEQHARVMEILKRLKMVDKEDVVLIDARADNKPAGSKAAA